MEKRSKFLQLYHSFTFRLALIYISLFGISVILLFGFIYSFAMRYIDTQINDSIRLQYSYLLNEYKQKGVNGVEQRINRLIEEDEDGVRVFLLVNGSYEKIAGNLNEWPDDAINDGAFGQKGSWVHFYIESISELYDGIKVKAVMAPLSVKRHILIGQTLQSNQRMEQIILQTFWASLIITLIMAFIGATIMTKIVARRLGVINRSIDTIMHGDISVRIPHTQGGDTFDDLSAHLNQMLDRIETLLLSLAQFANNIAHDLRSPLSRIINRLDDGLRTIDKENPATDLLKSNIHEMEELVSTFNSILKISELEANPDVIHSEQCDLGKIITKLAEFYEPSAAQKQINLTCEAEDDCIIAGEKNLLTQAFANLLDNAIKFTPKGGAISIQIKTSENTISAIFSDSGPGIPKDSRNQVFEKFFRLEKSRNTKGNGLGLSLVAATARIHKAEISLEDNHPGLKVIMKFTK